LSYPVIRQEIIIIADAELPGVLLIFHHPILIIFPAKI
jgi:hypothetical protein